VGLSTLTLRMAKVLSEDRLLGLMPWVSRWNGAGNVVVVVVVVVAIDDRQQTTKKTARNMLMLRVVVRIFDFILRKIQEVCWAL
jgi:hypothetical protein